MSLKKPPLFSDSSDLLIIRIIFHAQYEKKVWMRRRVTTIVLFYQTFMSSNTSKIRLCVSEIDRRALLIPDVDNKRKYKINITHLHQKRGNINQ